MARDFLQKYVAKQACKKGDLRQECLHSSGFAVHQNEGAMGATSTESFQTRRQVSRERKFVRGYGQSHLVQGAPSAAPRPRPYVAPPKTPLPPGR